MQWLFVFFTVGSFLFACFGGKMDALCTAALEGCADGVTLCFTLLGSMGFWSGILRIAEDSGLTKKLTRLLRAPVSLLFGRLKDEKALELICMNITANLMGLGNAATPLGLRAIKQLDALNTHAAQPSFAMTMLVVVNTASLQLIPTTVGFLRSRYGSSEPFAILPAALLCSLCTLTVAVCTVWLTARRESKL